MTTNAVSLNGCESTPLLAYLKALGIFRLVASPANNVGKTAADPDVRACWTNGHFLLRGKLDSKMLLEFFLDDYVPSPIIAPWNGGSGFYPKDTKEGLEPLTRPEIAKRFLPLREAIKIAKEEIDNRSLTSRPEDTDKVNLINALRNRYPASALRWLDAVVSFSNDRMSFPPLLGTGGNDGRLDFTNNFMQRLVSEKAGLFDAVTGKPSPHSSKFLETSLFGNASQGMYKAPVGQFDPDGVGGPNSTSVGYKGDSLLNPWDFVFMLEGSVMFAGAATRRHQSTRRSSASFPFMVRTVGAGYEGASDADERNSRAEFWAPVWNQSASYNELASLLKEGRAVLNGRTVNDGLDFARAVAGLGVSRGVERFERYGFVMRSGKAYLAVPLGTRRVSQKVTDGARLINDLDAGGWLERIRRFGRNKEDSSSHGREILRRFEDELFEMTQTDASTRSVQSALITLGNLVSWLAKNGTAFNEKPPPPPLLSSDWIRKANDGSFEFRVASALASLGWQSRQNPKKDPAIGETSPLPSEKDGHDPENPDQTAAENGTNSEQTSEFDMEIAMAAHLVPVHPSSIRKKTRRWDENQVHKALTVWGGGDLTSNLIAVLERRLIEQSARGLKDKPLGATTQVRLADISAFLDPGFDHARCGQLLCGLVWAQPLRYIESREQNTDWATPPFPYATLKPVFTTSETLKRLMLIPQDPNSHIPTPPGLVTQLRSGKVGEAVRTALDRMRASRIDSPFDSGQVSGGSNQFGFGVDGKLLAASLLIPLYEKDLEHVMKRAYNIGERKTTKKEKKDAD